MPIAKEATTDPALNSGLTGNTTGCCDGELNFVSSNTFALPGGASGAESSMRTASSIGSVPRSGTWAVSVSER